MVLLLAGEADSALLANLGLDAAALRARLAEGGAAVDAARLLLLAGHTGSRRLLALMLRGALLEHLSTVEKAAELRELATAMARLPAWVFEEAGPIQPPAIPIADHNPVAATAPSPSGAGCQPANINPVEATHASPAGSADILSARSADFQSASVPPQSGSAAFQAAFPGESPPPYPSETEHHPAAAHPAADNYGTTCEKGRGTTAREDHGDGAGEQDYSFTFDDSLPDDADPGPG